MYIYICIFVYVFLFLFGMKMTTSFCFFPVIRLNTEYVHYSRYSSHLWGYCSIYPCLNNSIRTLNGVFHLYATFYQQGLISNPIILIDSSWIFKDDIFSYVWLLALMFVSTIYYVFDWEDHILTKTPLAWNPILNSMIRGSFCEGICRQNHHLWFSTIYICFL